jgi:two-component system NtrC family sensor kinase
LLEVLGSLITNAIESIEDVGEVSLKGKLDATGRFLDLTVVDTGCGMDDEVKSHLYEPFFSTKRVDRMSGVSVEGRGLGLWNTYNLLRMHQGDLHIESEAGKGTTVWVKLPCCSPQTDVPSALP